MTDSPECSGDGVAHAEKTTKRVSAVELSSRLREAIMSGDLVPNQRLIEFDIAEEHGSSRGNVRIALSELTVEGLVEKVQNRGARVRAVSLEEAIEITEVRGAIEALCARRAAERIQEDQKQRLREIGACMTAAVEAGDRETYSECNRDLHSTVIEISGQQVAAQTIKRLRGQAVRFQYRLAQKPGRPVESLPQHLALIEGVCAQDPDAAASAMRAHISSVAQAIRAIEASK